MNMNNDYDADNISFINTTNHHDMRMMIEN